MKAITIITQWDKLQEEANQTMLHKVNTGYQKIITD